MIESDAAMTEDLVAYNIIPLDAPTKINVITAFPEVSSFILLVIENSYLQGYADTIHMQVQAAISAVKYFRGLPKLPDNFPIPASRDADIFDFLQYVFGFQVTSCF